MLNRSLKKYNCFGYRGGVTQSKMAKITVKSIRNVQYLQHMKCFESHYTYFLDFAVGFLCAALSFFLFSAKAFFFFTKFSFFLLYLLSMQSLYVGVFYEFHGLR